jgi:ATP-binding cassette, subfamily C (CFTR/MRP), member 1
LKALFSSLAKAIILLAFSQYMAVTMPFVIGVLYLLQSFYLQTSRQIRLLEIEAKAPLYTNFQESVAGAATIRAFGWESYYQERNFGFIDSSQRPAYLQHCIQHWLAFVLDMLVTGIAVVLVGIVVTWKDKFSAGSVGVSLVMVITFSTTLMRLIQMWTMMESSIGAVARTVRFVTETESEEGAGERYDAPRAWPQAGLVEFRSLVASHK